MSPTSQLQLEGVQDTFHLYTYYRSSCSARLRIALNLKGITPAKTFVNLIGNAQNDPDYTSVNPSHSVPTLVITKPSGQTTKITQSISALEYLEEAYPQLAPLLPKDVDARATARTLAQIIASDVQPVTNLRILVKIGELGGDRPAYAKEMMTAGLKAYEAIAKESAGKYSVGDEVSLADVCLVPAVWGAERFGVDFSELPTLKAVYDRLSALPEVQRAHWNRQEDTPAELRG